MNIQLIIARRTIDGPMKQINNWQTIVRDPSHAFTWNGYQEDRIHVTRAKNGSPIASAGPYAQALIFPVGLVLSPGTF